MMRLRESCKISDRFRIGAWGFFGGVPGVLVGTVYWGFDTFYEEAGIRLWKLKKIYIEVTEQLPRLAPLPGPMKQQNLKMRFFKLLTGATTISDLKA